MASRANSLSSFGLLWVLGILVYSNSLGNEFVFDDILVIRDNYYIKHPEYLSFLWNKSYFEFFGEQSYRPFVTLTYFADFQLWEIAPFGYRLDNLILHLVNSGLVWIFLCRLFPLKQWTLFAAALFTLHPIMTETMNVVGFREELLIVFCTLTSLLLFLKVDFNQQRESTNNLGNLFFSSAAFGVGLLAKENMLIFPLLAILICWRSAGWSIYPLNRYQKVYIIGLIGIWLGYVFIRFYWFRNEAVYDVQTPDLISRIFSGTAILGYYLKLWFFPLPLVADYTFPDITDWEWMRSSLTLLVIAGVTLRIWIRGSDPVRFGWFWFLIASMPTMNVYPIAHPIAERYLYFPWVGGCIVFSNILWSLKKSLRSINYPWIRFVSPLWILALFSLLTLDRNVDWKNSDTLWLQNVRVMPKSSRARNGVGIYYLGRKNYRLAIASFQRSIEIDPRNQQAFSNLGLAYHKATRNVRAEEALQRGLELNSKNPQMLINMGNVKAVLGKWDEGLELLNQAVSLQPYWVESYLARGNLFVQMKRYDNGYQDFIKASQIRPDYPEPWNNIGALLGEQNRFAEAVLAFKEALRIDSENKEAALNAAVAYYFLKDCENVHKYAKIALRLGVILPDFLSPLIKP